MNCNSERTKWLFGNGFGCGDRSVKVCRSVSTFVLKYNIIFN